MCHIHSKSDSIKTAGEKTYNSSKIIFEEYGFRFVFEQVYIPCIKQYVITSFFPLVFSNLISGKL